MGTLPTPMRDASWLGAQFDGIPWPAQNESAPVSVVPRRRANDPLRPSGARVGSPLAQGIMFDQYGDKIILTNHSPREHSWRSIDPYSGNIVGSTELKETS